MKQVFFFFPIVGMLLACNLASPSPTPTSKPWDAWLTTWLTTPTCQPPCWENIIPGTTLITSTIDVLTALSGTTSLRGPTLRSDGNVEVLWEFSSSRSSGGWILSDKDYLVNQIILQPAYDQYLPIKDVITAYGSPTHVFVTRGGVEILAYSVHLIYMPSGLALELLVPEHNYAAIITAETNIERISFFTPGGAGVYDSATLQRFQPWQGYQEYYMVP